MRLAITLAGLLVATPLFGGGTSTTTRAAVSTSSRFSTAAAIEVLRDGGNAADAAIAAAFVLAVARPDAAGVGGGGLLVYHERERNATWVVDFREAAPAKLPAMPKGEPLTGVSAAATPGLVRGLSLTHRRFGSKPWKELALPASRLAEGGFAVDDALAKSIASALAAGRFDSGAAAVFAPGSKPVSAGDFLVQKNLSASIAKIAKGPDVMRDGSLAIRISDASAKASGSLALRDFREYDAEIRAPLSVQAGAYTLVTAPPPSTGGVTVAATLAIMSGLDVGNDGPESTRFIHLLTEAGRRAMFDARRHVGDPAYSRVAFDQILSTERLRFWRGSIDPARASSNHYLLSSGTRHTTHIAVVDAKGNAASMTISLSGEFGCGWIAGDTGILLNAAMNDFRETVEAVEGESTPPLPPNAAEPKKRPASAAAPCILLFDGSPRVVIGAAGGEAIPHIVLAVLLRYATFNQSLADAIAAPRIFQSESAGQLACEKDRWPDSRLEALRAMGHGIEFRESIGEVNAILIGKSGIVAVADPRGQGATGGN